MQKTEKTERKVEDSTDLAQTYAEDGTDLAQTYAGDSADLRTLYAPLITKFRGYLNKSVGDAPQLWLPVETSLLFRYEFSRLNPQYRYFFLAILLYCGMRGIDEVPADAQFLANLFNTDLRVAHNALKELKFCGLLLERKKEREIRKDTDRQTEGASARVSVRSKKLSETEGENRDENRSDLLNGNPSASPSAPEKALSQFSIDECLRYVERCQKDGDPIRNAKALAFNLFKTGEADSFILAALYPEKQKLLDIETFGAPRRFSVEPCTVCFGAKMADVDGKGFRACERCRDERGKSTGREPEGGAGDD